jgi:hypothetical protein
VNPIRVQLSRKKGWRMPPNTIKVDRSTRWGNPFVIGKIGPMNRMVIDAESACGHFRAMLQDDQLRQVCEYPTDLSELRGRNLACWCDLDDFCHADILLQVITTESSQATAESTE